jgi:hypothetical protein
MTGQGVPSTEVEQLFFVQRLWVHALVLLRRRLQGLFGNSFQLEVRSEIEDEPSAAQCLPELLDDTCQVEVVVSAAKSQAGLRLYAELLPGQGCGSRPDRAPA